MRPIHTLVLLLILLTGCGELRGGTFEPPQAAPELHLADVSGRPFELAALRGQVVLLYFGYTSCPDLCPATLADLAAARRSLGADGAKVQVAFVSLDPARDTAAKLAAYVKIFDPTFVALRGEGPQLLSALSAYQVTATRRELPGSALGYAIDHTSFTYVVDRAGRLRELITFGAPVADIVSDLRLLVREDAQ